MNLRDDFRRQCARCCREPSMPFTWAFRPPLQRGGTCAVRTWNWLFWPQKIVASAHLKRLKLSVLYKCRLGGLQAPFWRPQGSILEGLGAIFAIFSHVLGHVVPRSSPSRSPFFLQQSSLVVMLLRLLDFSWTPAGFQLGSTLSASKGKCLNPSGCGGNRLAVSMRGGPPPQRGKTEP